MLSQLKIKAYAKINLSLKILGTRLDGYHNIDSIFQLVSLHDEITITLLDHPALEIICNYPGVPSGERNIIYKAVKALPAAKTGVRIEVIKTIPVSAGLGGGSSNAAAVLMGLNQLWELGLSLPELMVIGAKIGGDLPFFMVGGIAKVTGIGDKVEKINPVIAGKQVIIVKPDFGVATAWAYGEYDKEQQRTSTPAHQYINDLEPVVIARYPEIGQIKQKLLDLGAEWSLMSGSGSSVFGVFEEPQIAQKAQKSLKNLYSNTFLVTPL